MKKSGILPGIMLIAAGVILLASNIGLIRFDWNFIWPLFLLIPGLIFELSYFGSRRNPGVLVPGGILTIYGLFFYFNIITGWNFMDKLWPVFLLGPGFGLLQLYLFGGREKGVLIASTILGSLSLIFLSFSLFGFAADFIGPAALIVFGLFILTKDKKPRYRRNNYVHKDNHEKDFDDDLEDDLEEYFDTEEDDPK